MPPRRNDQPIQSGPPAANYSLPIRGRGGYYNSNQQRGYYNNNGSTFENYGQKSTKGKGYVNDTKHKNMQNITEILKVFKLPYIENEIFNIKELPRVEHIGARLKYV